MFFIIPVIFHTPVDHVVIVIYLLFTHYGNKTFSSFFLSNILLKISQMFVQILMFFKFK